MTQGYIRRIAALATILFSLGGCAALDQIRLGGATRTYDPSKVYLKGEDITVSRRADMDRYVCLSGPLMCEGFGQLWDCSCS